MLLQSYPAVDSLRDVLQIPEKVRVITGISCRAIRRRRTGYVIQGEVLCVALSKVA